MWVMPTIGIGSVNHRLPMTMATPVMNVDPSSGHWRVIIGRRWRRLNIRDTPQLCSSALLALKKGSQLIKYSRKGKPKFCPFRISSDETTLIWLSHKKERNLKVTSVTRIIPGQRTAVFKRYPRPEKDYLSFSLIYNNGERSLDLICKDQAEAEVWFSGLNALIPSGPRRRSRADGQSDRISCSDDGDFSRPSLDSSTSGAYRGNAFCSREPCLYLARSDVGSGNANMQLRASNGDVSRVSVSSAPSCSSQGSGPDDIESLGDVYVWGEVWCDGISSDGLINSLCCKTDALVPRPLESDVVLDVHQIACGFRHAALVTRQGEVFTWGEESGGRLGHGTDADTSRPRLVDTMTVCNVESIVCGEYHTCAISSAGDLFTWGDGTYNIGLLGHGTAVSHWIPKRVSGPVEGVQILSVACGTWHTALTSLNGKVFTFGDGTFGVLGHGDRESVAYPREVESLNGLRTMKVACGVWHTAAIVEVLGQAGVNVISRKLFTWGDGDKYRLGHGDKEARLVPTCVPSLIDYNFHQLACGHSMTVALTTSGHVMTWGSTAYGQLGNPQSDGKIPCVVQDRLSGELVEEIACGAYHVTALTSRSEVYTWGCGGNGRLGQGDVDDRKTPTLVEALKDRHVKSISCGSNFTACICIHKWVSGADQSVCSGCRLAFGFTRKRHNCYNCGLVHCHACSSRKIFKAALAPTPSKPHRVCDSCYAKLKAAESGISSTASKRNVVSRRSIDIREKFDRGDHTRSARVLLSPNTDPMRYIEMRPGKNHEVKLDPLSPVSSLAQLKDIVFPTSLTAQLQTALKPMVTPTPPPLPPTANSKPSSPYSRGLSPPPIFSGSIIDSLKINNEILDKEVIRLQAQVKSLKRKCELQEIALKKSEKKAEEATSLAAEESAKCNTVAKYIKSIEAQLTDMAEKVPTEIGDNLKAVLNQAESLLKDKGSQTPKVSSSLVRNSSENGQHPLARQGSGDIHFEGSVHRTGKSAVGDTREATGHQGTGNSSPSRGEITEQFEHGVYVTVVQNSDGTKEFKRVRFSKRRFAEQQAETWWKENQERVFKKYSYRNPSTPATSSMSTSNDVT